jgi:hypothetical protein
MGLESNAHIDIMPRSQSNTPLMALVDAAVSDSESSSSPLQATEAPNPERKNSPMEKLSFAEQIMTVLDDESFPYLIWMPDGRSFTIMDHKKFTSELMPKLFNIRNMSSFVRKLSRWGLNRYHKKETMNSDLFKHKDFQRGNWKLCSQIKCSGRHPISSIYRNRKESSASNKKVAYRAKASPNTPVPVSPTTSMSDLQDQVKNQYFKSLPMFNQTSKTASPSSVLADAALQSFLLEQNLTKVISDPAIRAKILALQVMRKASQQQQEQLSPQALAQSWLDQQQLSQQAMLQSLLAQSQADVNRARLAVAASYGNFS